MIEHMQIPGKRVRRTRLVQSERFVVAVPVELVFPDEDPSEPCYEATTINLLKDVQAHADAGDLTWLSRHGKVYEAVSTASNPGTSN
jgi:hypothetical protein